MPRGILLHGRLVYKHIFPDGISVGETIFISFISWLCCLMGPGVAAAVPPGVWQRPSLQGKDKRLHFVFHGAQRIRGPITERAFYLKVWLILKPSQKKNCNVKFESMLWWCSCSVMHCPLNLNPCWLNYWGLSIVYWASVNISPYLHAMVSLKATLIIIPPLTRIRSIFKHWRAATYVVANETFSFSKF